jgi:hypothetical protein
VPFHTDGQLAEKMRLWAAKLSRGFYETAD